MLFDRPAVRCFYIRGKVCKYAKEHVCNGEDFEDLPGDLKICKGRGQGSGWPLSRSRAGDVPRTRDQSSLIICLSQPSLHSRPFSQSINIPDRTLNTSRQRHRHRSLRVHIHFFFLVSSFNPLYHADIHMSSDSVKEREQVDGGSANGDHHDRGPEVTFNTDSVDHTQVAQELDVKKEKSQDSGIRLLHVDQAPPLPAEGPPSDSQDDGWDPLWDDNAQAYYFYNRFTAVSQWTNPRVPEPTPSAPGVGNYDRIPEKAPGTEDPPQRPYGGYDPAIHGDYDPTASYAQQGQPNEDGTAQPVDPAAIYTATGVFNRFTGKWQPHSINPENHNDENKSKRQMSAFFDVDAAANSHNGKSLKAERSGKKLTRQELKAFKEKRKEKKDEKRKAWLRD